MARSGPHRFPGPQPPSPPSILMGGAQELGVLALAGSQMKAP